MSDTPIIKYAVVCGGCRTLAGDPVPRLISECKTMTAARLVAENAAAANNAVWIERWIDCGFCWTRTKILRVTGFQSEEIVEVTK